MTKCLIYQKITLCGFNHENYRIYAVISVRPQIYHNQTSTQQKWDTAMTVVFTFLMCWLRGIVIFASRMRCFLWVSGVETGYYFGVGELDVNTFHKETAAGLCDWKWLQLQIIRSLSLSLSILLLLLLLSWRQECRALPAPSLGERVLRLKPDTVSVSHKQQSGNSHQRQPASNHSTAINLPVAHGPIRNEH